MAYSCRFLVCVSEDGVYFLNPGSSVLTHSSCPWGARPASDSCSHLLTCCGQLPPLLRGLELHPEPGLC